MAEYRSSGSEQQPIEQSQHGGQEAAEVLQQQAGQVTMKVREQAKSQLSGQKERAAEQLRGVVDALGETAQSLRQQDHAGIAGYTDSTAQQLERVAQQLQQKDVDQLLKDAGNAIRQRRGLFLGGAFVVGVLGARFLKSAAPAGGTEATGATVLPYEAHASAARGPAPADPWNQTGSAER
jgi:hypothetical protein